MSEKIKIGLIEDNRIVIDYFKVSIESMQKKFNFFIGNQHRNF